MRASEVMTTKVIAVRPDTPARAIALVLLEHGISAAPVVDDSGAPIGMVSEGDLMPRDESERLARRDWWLKLLAEGEELSAGFVDHLEHTERTAREIMSSPVLTVDEQAELVDVAEILARHRIKRVPVVREGRLVGIVSRADLVRTVASHAKPAEAEPKPAAEGELLFPSDRLEALAPRRTSGPALPGPVKPELSADGFRGLVAYHEKEEEVHHQEAHRLALERRREEARHMMNMTLTDEAWERMLGEARTAAQHGETEHMVLRFPCELCTDHGRAVNAPDPGWPATLRGLAADVFLRWKRELRPHGFGLHARVIDFPGGVPGDIGLFLAWGK